MNSHIWQDQLQACQADILKSGGSLGGGVKSVLRNLAFVQPRFESEATPRRRYVCLLRAIARVLMVKACDPRSEPAVRRRAREALTAMEERSDAVMAGLAGDYSETCVVASASSTTCSSVPRRPGPMRAVGKLLPGSRSRRWHKTAHDMERVLLLRQN